MSAPFTVPVVFIVYNRPQHARFVFEAIRRLRPTTLYLIADGPKNAADAVRCAESRAIFEEIDWDCTVHRKFADRNLGAKYGLAGGLSWVFDNVPEAVILEDDCVPEPSFFPYCAELLERYRDDERVMEIAGSNYLLGRHETDSYYFSKYTHCCGWATWSRAWKHYDVEMSRWPEARDSHALEHLWPTAAERRYWRRAFDALHDGRRPTWDGQWTFAMWCNSGLSIVPPVNLISNIGFGAGATFTTEPSPIASLPTEAIGELRHPAFVVRDAAADRIEWQVVYSDPLIRRIPRGIRRRVRALFNKKESE